MAPPTLADRWPTLTREFKAGVVLEFRRQGRTFWWIAETCGISIKAAHKLAWDPDGSKKRAYNQKYQGVCIDCGGTTARTSSGNGGTGPAKRCLACYRAHRRATATGPPSRPHRPKRVALGVPLPTPGWGDLPRHQKVTRLQALRDLGHSNAEIAESLGIKTRTIANLLYDPDGSKQRARRERYAGTCLVCGARTDGSRGPGKAPELCTRCHGKSKKFWTKADLIERIQAWAETYGGPPGARDWNPTMARLQHRPDIAERFYQDGCWPTAGTVQETFGSWNEGILAAGFWPRKPGGRGAGIPPAVALLAEAHG